MLGCVSFVACPLSPHELNPLSAVCYILNNGNLSQVFEWNPVKISAHQKLPKEKIHLVIFVQRNFRADFVRKTQNFLTVVAFSNERVLRVPVWDLQLAKHFKMEKGEQLSTSTSI